MSKFAQIEKNTVWWVFEADKCPEFAPNIVIKDITNLNPQPQEGWNYDPATETFSPPQISTPEPIQPQPTNEEIRQNQLTIMAALADLYADMAEKGTV